jgi:tetratricopeptide (TPR) repeat protein
LEAASEERRGARSLVVALAAHAEPVAVLGDPVTDGQALVLFRLRPGPPWEPEDRLELWEGLEGGATEAPFLGDLAAYLTDHGKLERAIEVLRLALRWDPTSPRLWNNFGATLLVSGELSDAAEALTEGLRIHPNAIELRHTLGVVYLEMEVPERALRELRTVLAARPNDPRVHFDVARAAVALKRWELAVHALEAYLATEPDPQDRDQALASLAEARRLARVEP